MSFIHLNMLSQLQKKHLARLLEHYNFEHLRPPPEVYEINYPQEEHFQPSASDRKRRIFYRVKYEIEEERAIQETKREMKKQGISEKISDEVILKHVYGGNWDIDKIIDRLKQVIQYHYNEKIIKLDSKTIEKLEKGQVYTYGHDKHFRPNVFMRIDKFDLTADIDDHFNSVYYLMLVVLGFRMVPYHSEKYNLILDLNNISFTKIPYRTILTSLDKLATYYCGNTEKTFVYNSGGIGYIWNLISVLLPESQKRRIIFIQEGEESKILQYIDEYQLEKRYGGKLQNLTDYWPPKNTNESFDLKMNSSMTESEFLSIQNDEEYFKIEGEEGGICGSSNCQCIIF